MTFKEYLTEKGIPFKEEGEDIWVEDVYLIPFMDEVLSKFPELTFDLEIDEFEDQDDLEDWDDIDVDVDLEDWEDYWKDMDDMDDSEEKAP